MYGGCGPADESTEDLAMTDGLITIVVVDDHWLVRLGLNNLFGRLRHFALVGEASTVEGALAAARTHKPDVVIMDVRLPDGSGIEACRQIRSDDPGTRVIMLTSFSDDEAVIASILAGASGYLLKQSEPERLIAAVETASAGGSLLDPAVAETVVRWMRGAALASNRSSD